MKSNKLVENQPTPGAEDLLRVTSRSHQQAGGLEDGSREAFVALGEVLESAIGVFDWKKIAARLEAEVMAASVQDTLSRVSEPLSGRPLRTAPRRGAFTWISLSSAVVLLVSLTIGLALNPTADRLKIAQGDPKKGSDKKLGPTAPAIDSWAQTPTASESNSPWTDEIDIKLAATQRALKAGRDPWVGDEPALSEVFAQIGELTAGLAFEPF